VTKLRQTDLIVARTRGSGQPPLGSVTQKTISPDHCPIVADLVLSAKRALRPSNALPQAGLLIEPIQFEAAKVKPRDDPDDLAIIDDRQMAVAVVFHQP
jgi:hypothetical protein